MADHILCEAERKGLEAHISSLTEGYTLEIRRLLEELTMQKTAQATREDDNKELHARIMQLTNLNQAHDADVQQLKQAHAAELAAIRSGHTDQTNVMMREKSQILEQFEQAQKAVQEIGQQASDLRATCMTQGNELRDARQQSDMAEALYQKKDRELSALHEEYNTLNGSHERQMRRVQATGEKEKETLKKQASDKLRQASNEWKVTNAQVVAAADGRVAAEQEENRKRKLSERLARANKRLGGELVDLTEDQDPAATVTVTLYSTTFRAVPTYSLALSDTMHTLATKLSSDVSNLSILEMEFGVMCAKHRQCQRRISRSTDFNLTMAQVRLQ